MKYEIVSLGTSQGKSFEIGHHGYFDTQKEVLHELRRLKMRNPNSFFDVKRVEQ